MRLGYIVLSHRDAPQVARHVNLIRSLDPTATIVVSHDERDAAGARELAALGVTVQTDRGARADFGGIERWLRAVEAMATERPDHVVLISGQDHLIVPPSRIKAELDDSDGQLEHFDALHDAPWKAGEGRTRYLFTWRETIALSHDWSRRLHFLHAVNKVQPLVRTNVVYGRLRVALRNGGPPAPYRVYGGSQWNALSWRVVQRVRAVVRDDAAFMRWARRALIPDESFFQTVVLNQRDLRVGQGSKRYYDFSSTSFGHPKVLELNDFPRIVGSDAWFARKLDWATSRPLIDRLERYVRALELTPPSSGRPSA